MTSADNTPVRKAIELGGVRTAVCVPMLKENESIGVLIRATLPRCIGMGKVAFDAKLGSKLLVAGILGSVVQRQRSSACGRKILESPDDGLIGLCSSLAVELGDQDEATLSLDQGI